MFWKQNKLEQELKNGEAEVVRGILEDKFKFVGRKQMSDISGSGRMSSRNKGRSILKLVFDGKEYYVQPKMYKAAEKGTFSELVWLPSSKYVISVETV